MIIGLIRIVIDMFWGAVFVVAVGFILFTAYERLVDLIKWIKER